MESTSLLPFVDRAVHVWALRLEAPLALVSQFEKFLSRDEAARAGRFNFDYLRSSFILAHGALRLLLAGYLDARPAEIEFACGANGKPSVAASTPLQFNLSHSNGLALLAFTSGCELGIDIEKVRPMPDLQQIASRFFCAEETAELMSLPRSQRDRAFFLCWTRKEAYIKAIGVGLSAPLDRFAVSLRPAEPAQFLHLDGDQATARQWTLHDCDLGSAYVGALAYRDAPRPLLLLPPMNPLDFIAFFNRVEQISNTASARLAGSRGTCCNG